MKFYSQKMIALMLSILLVLAMVPGEAFAVAMPQEEAEPVTEEVVIEEASEEETVPEETEAEEELPAEEPTEEVPAETEAEETFPEETEATEEEPIPEETVAEEETLPAEEPAEETDPTEEETVPEETIEEIIEEEQEMPLYDATSGKCGDNVSWKLDNGVLTISGTGPMYDFSDPMLTAEEDSRMDAPWPRTAFKKVVIQSGVTSIGDNAFYDECSNSILEEATLPEGITSIGVNAFLSCRFLKTINFPSTLTTIGSFAFEGCESLESISLPESCINVGGYAFNNCYHLSSAVLSDKMEKIPNDLFSGCEYLESVNIPASCKSIGNNAFSGCYGLEELTIPATVTSIGAGAFNSCYNLKILNFMGACPTFGENWEPWSGYSTDVDFSDFLVKHKSSTEWTNLEKGYANRNDVLFFVKDATPNGRCGAKVYWALDSNLCLTFSGSGEMFEYESGYDTPWSKYDQFITKIVVEDGVTSFPQLVPTYAGGRYPRMTAVELGNGLTAIPYQAFSWCNALTTITLSEGLTTIGMEAFYGCPMLNSIVVPNTVTSIENGAFAGCTRLESVTLSQNLTIIEDATFVSCHALKSIVLPDSIATIGRVAFAGCSKLSSINWPAKLTSIEENAFENTAFTSVSLPTRITAIGNRCFADCKALKFADIPCKEIPEYAFSGCTALDSVLLRNTTSIGAYAFSGCTALTGITFPDTVETIGEKILDGCTSLEAILFLGDAPTIHSNAFNKLIADVFYIPTRTGWNTVANKNYGGALNWMYGTSILTQPVSQSVPENASAAFKVVATGEGLEYRWQFNTGDGVWRYCSSATAGYHSATLKPVATMMRNGYRYRCEVTNENGATVMSDEVTLSVYVFKFTTQPSDQTVQENATAAFAIATNGENITYQWQYSPNGSNWANCSSATTGYHSKVLKPVGTSARNGYRYRCIATDSLGNSITSVAAKLNVVMALRISTQPANQAVEETKVATFKVVAVGNGLTYQWQYLMKGTTEWKNCSSATTGYNTATLQPVGASSRNGHKYRCIVTDQYGFSVTSEAATLTVATAPKITMQPMNQSVGEDKAASFTVKATGTGLTYQWYYSVNGSNFYKCSSATAGYNKATLNPVATVGRNGYSYYCIVTNSSGMTTKSATAVLKVVDLITILVQPENTAAAADTTAAFTAFAAGQGISYRWQYRVGDGTWTNCPSSTPGYNATTLNLTAAKTLNGNQYRCVVIDAKGRMVATTPATLTVF